MCKGHGIYKCGKCYSCRARKRNDIMIRLTEHYRGLYRHFIQPHIAVMFGVMTFDDNFIPNVNLNLDVVCDWQRPVQKFLANVRAKYPFLNFQYFISAEFGGKTGRLHLHPLFMVTPKYEMLESVGNYKNLSQLKRKLDCISALEDGSLYTRVSPLFNSHKYGVTTRKHVNLTAFQTYIYDLLQEEWYFGMSDIEPVLSVNAVKYVTKYTLKATDPRFARHYWRLKTDFWKPLKKSVIPHSVLHKCKSKSKYDVGFDVEKHTMYKQYLISNGIGKYFFETQQARELLHNLAFVEQRVKVPLNLHDDIEVSLIRPNKRLVYRDPTYIGKDKNEYSLPSSYKQHILDLYFGNYTPERAVVGQSLQFQFKLSSICKFAQICRAYNYPFHIDFKFNCDDLRPVDIVFHAERKYINLIHQHLDDIYNNNVSLKRHTTLKFYED